MLQIIITIFLFVSESVSQEGHGGMNSVLRTDGPDHETDHEYMKGDPGIVRLTDPRVDRVRRDGTQGQLPLSSDNSPFMAPVQTSYFLGQCLMCPPGGPGPRGPPGQPGRDGRDGRDQALYPVHTDGERSDDSDEHTESVTHGASNHTNVGVTYTRWGKTNCPLSSRVVNEGVMAGAHHNQKGGGANYICLSADPIFDEPQAGEQFATRIYGTEYQTSGFPGMGHLQQVDVPCVVCLALSKHHALTIMGRNQCPQQYEWTLEYSGFIMAAHSTHQRTEYVCIDKTPEGIPRTNSNDNFAMVYPVEAKCGSNGGGLPCPPYVDGYEVTCAVCTI